MKCDDMSRVGRNKLFWSLEKIIFYGSYDFFLKRKNCEEIFYENKAAWYCTSTYSVLEYH